MSKRYRSCPNPECKSTNIEVGWVLNSGREGEPFMFCVGCHLQGPKAKTRAEAERLWSIMPRDAAHEIHEIHEHARKADLES